MKIPLRQALGLALTVIPLLPISTSAVLKDGKLIITLQIRR